MYFTDERGLTKIGEIRTVAAAGSVLQAFYPGRHHRARLPLETLIDEGYRGACWGTAHRMNGFLCGNQAVFECADCGQVFLRSA